MSAASFTRSFTSPHPSSFRPIDKKKIVVVGDGQCGKTSLLMMFVHGQFPTDYVPTVFETHSVACKVPARQKFMSRLLYGKEEAPRRIRIERRSSSRPNTGYSYSNRSSFSSRRLSFAASSISRPSSSYNGEEDEEYPMRSVTLSLWDTAGQEDYDRLRPLSYPHTNVILMAYSVDSPVSLANVRNRWYPEVRHFLPGVPIVLVGCKSDRRYESLAMRNFCEWNQSNRFSVVDCVSTEAGETIGKAIGAKRFLECSAMLGTGVEDVFLACAEVALKKDDRGKKCLVM